MKPYQKQISSLIPEYDSSMTLSESLGELTYDGVRVLGAYFLLLDQGKVSDFPVDIYKYLNVHDALKIKIWKKNLLQRPDTKINNDKRIELLEKIPGQYALYRFIERMTEGGQYTSRFKNYSTFKHYVKEEIGGDAEEVFKTFDNYFDIIWENSLKNKEGYLEKDKPMIRDLMLLMNIYHFLHRLDYQDGYLLECFTNATQFNEIRSWIGKNKDGSLGTFQGYDRGLSEILSDNPNLVQKLINSDDKDISSLAKRWQGLTKEQIYDDLKTGHFLYGAKSPVYFYWKISMIAQCQAVLNYYNDIVKMFRGFDVKDPNLKFTLSLVLRKSKVKEISQYLRKDFLKDISNSESGDWLRIPSTRTHIYLEALEMLQKAGKISESRNFLFYFQAPDKLSNDEVSKIDSDITKSAA